VAVLRTLHAPAEEPLGLADDASVQTT